MDFYEILGVTKQSTTDDIKKAYRKMAFQYHPDRNPGDLECCDKFKQATQAYTTLSDPNLRARYDMVGMTPPRPTPSPKKKPEKKKDPRETAWENRHHGFTYADGPQPEVDLWGDRAKRTKEEFKDIFSGAYENGDQLDIR